MRIHSQKIEKMNIVQRVSQLSEVDPKKLQGKPFLRNLYVCSLMIIALRARERRWMSNENCFIQ